MAHDPVHAAKTFPGASEDAFHPLRTAIEQRLRGADVTDDLRDALRALQRQARERALFVEDILVPLRALLQSLPEVQRLEDAQERTRLMERIITMCVEEYYA